MTAHEVLAKVKALGVELRPDGRRILYRPVDAVPDDLMADLRTHKEELLDLLTWPPECLESEQEHGHPAARLFPLRGRTVQTPMGLGRLVAALPERALVVLDRRSLPFAFLPGEVAPAKIAPSGEIRSAVH